MSLRPSDFDYTLPASRIAQRPAPRRDAARLLLLHRRTGAVEHRRVRSLPSLLDPGDLVVVNDTRVIPARLRARKPTGGGLEVLLCEPRGRDLGARDWTAMVRGAGKIRPGLRAEVEGGGHLTFQEPQGDGFWEVFLEPAGGTGTLDWLQRVGRVPLPPYIRARSREATHRRRYQTVFAREPGAVAAPTAGLHFTRGMLNALQARGVHVASLTLHVGPGTFLPVRCATVESHRMHAERFRIPPETAQAVADARRRGGRVVAVGTTVVRALEASARGREVRAGEGVTDLFIYPGYAFQVVDELVTNFHLPRSTLLMLVAALAGREKVLAAYRAAVREGYRFYSYGDAMYVRDRG